MKLNEEILDILVFDNFFVIPLLLGMAQKFDMVKQIKAWGKKNF